MPANFLSRYLWDDVRMLERHQGMLAEAIGEVDGMHSVGSSEIAKKGSESVGVSRQYCGSLGKVDNCQSGFFSATAAASAMGWWTDGFLCLRFGLARRTPNGGKSATCRKT